MRRDLKLEPQLLSALYSRGLFPMADQKGRIEVYMTPRRALLPITGIHVSRKLARKIRNCGWRITFDTAFEEVIRGCFRPTDNWLTEEFVEAYTACHQQGWAHSGEVWDGDRLIGGVYGLAIGGCFSAESMFHRETDASKIALWALVEECRRLGFVVFDAQILNPHLESLGAYEIDQFEFDLQLETALKVETKWSTGRPSTALHL